MDVPEKKLIYLTDDEQELLLETVRSGMGLAENTVKIQDVPCPINGLGLVRPAFFQYNKKRALSTSFDAKSAIFQEIDVEELLPMGSSSLQSQKT